MNQKRTSGSTSGNGTIRFGLQSGEVVVRRRDSAGKGKSLDAAKTRMRRERPPPLTHRASRDFVGSPPPQSRAARDTFCRVQDSDSEKKPQEERKWPTSRN